MKTILKITIPFFMLLLFTGVVMADIHVTVFGKGGIIVKPDSSTVVCPYSSNAKCADIIVEDDLLENLTGVYGKLIYQGITYNVKIIEMPHLRKYGNGYACQGVVVMKQ
ncbi:MAG: hypothetical protein U9R60_10180 [Bacteroidota bacterium]|nr:hypothetical protein [Bacteroidota bacterium]